MNLMLSFWTNISDRFQLPMFTAGIVLAILGVTLGVLAKRITRVVRKSNTIENNDKILISLKLVGLILLFFALILLIFTNSVKV